MIDVTRTYKVISGCVIFSFVFLEYDMKERIHRRKK